MMTLVLPVALIALVGACASKKGARDTLLRALVLFGVTLAVMTELLGSVHLLLRGPLFLAWCLVTVLAVGIAKRRGLRPTLRLSLRRKWNVLDALIVLGLAAIPRLIVL